MNLTQRFKAALSAFREPSGGRVTHASTTRTPLPGYQSPSRLTLRQRQQIARNPYIYAALRNTADELCGKWNGAAGYVPKNPSEEFLRRPAQILAASDDPRHAAQAEALRWNIDKRVKRGWDQVFRQLLNARKHGKSVQEIKWAYQPDGQYRGAWVIDDLLDCPPDCFSFRYDRVENRATGEVDYKRVMLYDPNASGNGTPVPDGKFLVYTFDREMENDDGESILSKLDLYDWYQRNNFIFWMTDLNRYGSPLIVGTAPKGAGDAQRQALLEAIDSVQQETGIVISEDERLELLQAQRNGASGFELLNSILNYAIAVVLTGNALSMEGGGKGVGSYALAKATTAEIRMILLYALATQIDAVMNHQLIPVWMRYNFPVETDFPFQQTLPPRAEEVSNPVAPAADLNDAVPTKNAVSFSAKLPSREGQGVGKSSRELPEDRLFAVAAKQGIDVYESSYLEPLSDAIRSAERQEITAVAVQNIGFDDALPELLTRTLVAAHVLGRWQIMQEVKSVPRTAMSGFADDAAPLQGGDGSGLSDIETGNLLETPLLIERAREIVLQKGIMNKRRFQELTDQAKRQAFTIAGVEQERIMAQVQAAIAAAIQPGVTIKEIEQAARDAFRTYGVTWQTPFHAETVFRTNIQSALHDARWEMLHDPQINAQVAFLEYEAMEDSRVRASHRMMDGVIRPIDDPVWQTWWPPNGYNCRCRVRAISQDEAQRRSLSQTIDLPPAQPDDGFRNGPGRW